MTGEEAATSNELKISQVSCSLMSMEIDLQFIEGIINLWLQAFKEGHPFPSSERNIPFSTFRQILDQTEKRLQVKLTRRNEFEECVRSTKVSTWQQVITLILPNIRSEIVTVLSRTLDELCALPNPLWSDLLPKTFADQVLPPFRAEQYLSAVRRGCDMLRATIREKTGFHNLDGVNLVNQAYGKDSDFVVATWEGHSEESVQRGYADMLRGAMSAIRNVHYHGTEELDKMEAARLLVNLGTLWLRADGTTKL